MIPYEMENDFINTIVFADFEKKILVGKGKAKQFQKPMPPES